MINSSFDNENHLGYTEAVVHIDVFTAANGCDFTRYITLEVLKTSESFHSQEICDGESFMGYTETGQYEDTYTNVIGCDSIRHIDLASFSAGVYIVHVKDGNNIFLTKLL